MKLSMDIDNRLCFLFVKKLLEHTKIKELEYHHDQGVKVTTHTYDVLKLSLNDILKEYGSLEKAKKELDLFAIVIGIIIHDLSKGSLRAIQDGLSHSQVMLKRPEYIIKETESLLEELEDSLRCKIVDKTRKNIVHIVVSHHGKWGKIQPATKEAHIVHKADMYSAKYHRINPVSADKILDLMMEGYNLDIISKKLNCTSTVIKDRLKRAKNELRLKTTKQLLGYYKNKKRIPIGDEFFTKRVRETDKLIKAVEKDGFMSLVLKNQLIKYLEDSEVFQRKEIDEREIRYSFS